MIQFDSIEFALIQIMVGAVCLLMIPFAEKFESNPKPWVWFFSICAIGNFLFGLSYFV